MTYACVKEFTDVHFHITIPVGHITHLYEINEKFEYVVIDLMGLHRMTYPYKFFFGHFKPLNELRYKKLEEILNI